MEEREKKVRDIIAMKLGVNESMVVPSALLVEDLNADSLDLVELVMAFEDTFDIDISDVDAERMKTVQDVIDYIQTHV